MWMIIKHISRVFWPCGTTKKSNMRQLCFDKNEFDKTFQWHYYLTLATDEATYISRAALVSKIYYLQLAIFQKLYTKVPKYPPHHPLYLAAISKFQLIQKCILTIVWYICTNTCFNWGFTTDTNLSITAKVAEQWVLISSFPHCWPFVRGIHQSPKDSHTKGL